VEWLESSFRRGPAFERQRCAANMLKMFPGFAIPQAQLESRSRMRVFRSLGCLAVTAPILHAGAFFAGPRIAATRRTTGTLYMSAAPATTQVCECRGGLAGAEEGEKLRPQMKGEILDIQAPKSLSHRCSIDVDYVPKRRLTPRPTKQAFVGSTLVDERLAHEAISKFVEGSAELAPTSGGVNNIGKYGGCLCLLCCVLGVGRVCVCVSCAKQSPWASHDAQAWTCTHMYVCTVTLPDGRKYVLRIYNNGGNAPRIRWEHEILRQLNEQVCVCVACLTRTCV
jgi:hypothetical protein